MVGLLHQLVYIEARVDHDRVDKSSITIAMLKDTTKPVYRWASSGWPSAFLLPRVRTMASASLCVARRFA
jgi:hypothetical protein